MRRNSSLLGYSWFSGPLIVYGYIDLLAPDIFRWCDLSWYRKSICAHLFLQSLILSSKFLWFHGVVGILHILCILWWVFWLLVCVAGCYYMDFFLLILFPLRFFSFFLIFYGPPWWCVVYNRMPATFEFQPCYFYWEMDILSFIYAYMDTGIQVLSRCP